MPYFDILIAKIYPWQTLVGAIIAIVAALIAVWNTSRTLRNAKKLEFWRRERKHAALRAVLPLVLSEISEYAESTVKPLVDLHDQCAQGVLVHAGLATPHFKQVPTDVIKSLSDFIEYSDHVSVQLLVALIRRMQVHQARLRSLTSKIADWNETTSEYWVQSVILQGAMIYAGAAAAFDYSRAKTNELPEDITWDGVRSALNNMSLWNSEVPELHERIAKYEEAGAKPS